MNAPLIAPSLLSADLSCLRQSLAAVAGADYLHFDVMDGHFVPNLTFGPAVIQAVKRACDLPVDAHLMVDDPDGTVDWYLDAGADIVSVHVEAARHLDRLVSHIKERGAKAGVVLNPATPVEVLEDIVDAVDLVLIMSVNPGFGGQAFIPNTFNKLARLSALLERHGAHPLVEIDGGVSHANAEALAQAGVTMLVAGSAVFGADDPAAEVEAIRAAGAAGMGKAGR